MNRLRFCGTLVTVLAALRLLGPPHLSSEQQEPSRQSFGEQVSVSWVLVPVVVKGANGSIDNLDRDEFQLLVDGVEVEIGSFESGSDVPFSLFFLQDLSGSMELVGKIQSSRRVLGYFLDRAHPGDRFALFSFAGRRVDMSVPLTSDVSQLRSAARAWKPYGTTALHDAIAWLPRFIVDRPSTRRAVLLVSDGLDNASSVDPGDARQRIRASETPVYVIGLETGSPFETTSEGKKRHRYADVMNLLAHLTGGRYHSVFDQQELDGACAAVLEDLRHQYILGFSAGGQGESAPRSIEVRVKRRNAEVSHRQGYEGRPPLEPKS